jgi:hypothetical protein
MGTNCLGGPSCREEKNIKMGVMITGYVMGARMN